MSPETRIRGVIETAQRVGPDVTPADDHSGSPDEEKTEFQGGAQEPMTTDPACALNDFHAYLPAHQYINVHTRELWPPASVDGAVPSIGKMKPSAWLDVNRPLHQMTWHPGKPELICDHLVQVSGWTPHEGARVFNLYKAPPPVSGGNPADAGPWIDHMKAIYPDDAEHITNWLAFKLRYPGEKINHALVLGGPQGIGKDTLLEPVKFGIGPWNWQDITAPQMLGRFNGWVKGVIVRLSEARNLGDVDRFSFYENSKTIIAAPPDVIRVDEKNLREHYVVNVLGLVITSNNKTDGLFLPADDRRHYVAWSSKDKDAFTDDYWKSLYRWYGDGGTQHVIAYLRSLDLADFNPKAPPPKTAAFWTIVQAGEAPESGELRDVLDSMAQAGKDTTAITLGDLIDGAEFIGLQSLAEELRDRKARRTIPHRLDRMGYMAVRNPNARDGLWVVADRRQAIYAKSGASVAEQMRAAQQRAKG